MKYGEIINKKTGGKATSKDTMTLAEFREKKREAEKAIEKILNDFMDEMAVGIENVYVYDNNALKVTQDASGCETVSCCGKKCTIVARL